MKGLLRERKVDLLVDPDLKQNYDQKEVEELIQVPLNQSYFQQESGYSKTLLV